MLISLPIASFFFREAILAFAFENKKLYKLNCELWASNVVFLDLYQLLHRSGNLERSS